MVWLFALNSNLILLILLPSSGISSTLFPLNSNLILLIPTWEKMKTTVSDFKFQSDSINTLTASQMSFASPPLNSNLILLIPHSTLASKYMSVSFKFQSDSINTEAAGTLKAKASIFKFQSDSINTFNVSK